MLIKRNEKKGNGNSNILCKFKLHGMQIFFFQNGDLKIFSGGNHLPYLPSLTVYLNPPEGGTHFFPVKMTAKDVVEMVLVTLLLVLWRQGNHPSLVRRGLKINGA